MNVVQMFDTLEDYAKLRTEVFNVFKFKITKFIQDKGLDIIFDEADYQTIGISSPVDVWFRVHVIDRNDDITERTVRVRLRIGQHYYTRDDESMWIIDNAGHFFSLKKKLSDVDLVLLRIFYSILHITDKIVRDKVPSIYLEINRNAYVSVDSAQAGNFNFMTKTLARVK